MKNRKLKVYETEYQTNNPNGFWYCSKKSVSIPQIRLQGKWLQECGFEPGSTNDKILTYWRWET